MPTSARTAEFLVFIRRAGCPYPVCPLSAAFSVMCHCEPVTDATGVAIRPPALRLRWLPFFRRRKKGRKERRQTPWFWNPFRGRGADCTGPFQPREPGAVKSAFAFAYSLRLIPRRALRLCWPGGTGEPSASAVRGDVGIAPHGFLSVTGA